MLAFLRHAAKTMTAGAALAAAGTLFAQPDAALRETDDMQMKMKITVNGQTLNAVLEDNATARAFAAKLPITLPMTDLYDREMCCRLPEPLPANEARTRSYKVGEIIYYPPLRSFVIMYAQNGERFRMQSVGRVSGNVEIFAETGDADVRFEKAE